MIWVCRAGMNSAYLDYFLEEKKIFLPWEGFRIDLSSFNSKEELKQFVAMERAGASKTAVATWAGQIRAFVHDMEIGDLVLIPHQGSKLYTLAHIIGNYRFTTDNTQKLWHSRDICVIKEEIPRSAFSQSLQYSMGAYRTVFRIKDEKAVAQSLKPFRIDLH